ncbi:MAG: phosphoglycerate kinase [Planktomarina sp.]|nr:phosphoglycerate kinase [Planktomarina sp.]
MSWNTLGDMDLNGKRVLTRVDINVPFEGNVVSDRTRMDRIAPTVNHILKYGGTPILIAHYGRPGGKNVPEMSLKSLLSDLEISLGHSVKLTSLKDAKENIKIYKNQVVLIENIRFQPGEEVNDTTLAHRLANLGDFYCNDAFSTAHRAHASTTGLAHLLPSCAGLLMASELNALQAALGAPKRPLVAVVGGAKVSTKLDLLENLITKVDHLIIGGAMANTFIAALGHEVGASLCEHGMADTARRILYNAKNIGCEIILPSDVIVAEKFAKNAKNMMVNASNCPAEYMILDVGDKTITQISECISNAKTVIWNGPLGAFELTPFDRGTSITMQTVAKLTKSDKIISVAGGGDTVAALNHAGVGEAFTYISTAGGAFLEWMEGKELPGVAALNRKKK